MSAGEWRCLCIVRWALASFMRLQVDIFSVDGKLAQLSSEFQTAISSRHCLHPTVPVLAAGTASGRMLVYR